MHNQNIFTFTRNFGKMFATSSILEPKNVAGPHFKESLEPHLYLTK